MPQADLIKCSSCQSIVDLICEIDEKLHKIATNHYKNDVLELNLPYDKELTYKLIEYRRIFEKKLFNPSYSDYKQSTLISRIKVLLNA